MNMNRREDNKTANWQMVMNITNIVGIILTIWFLVWAYQEGLFTSEVALQNYMAGLGIWAPIVYFFLQIVQTVVPVIPGTISIPLAPVIFGHLAGYIINITAILIGSVIDFFLARRYGTSLVRIIVGEHNYQKGMEWLSRGDDKIEKILVILLILPFTPGDLLCYIAGLTNMTFKKFLIVILIGKPINVLIYTYTSLFVFKFILQLFQ